MAKKYIKTVLNVPFLDIGEDGKSVRTWATFNLTADAGECFCKRRVKRIVRKWLQYKLDRRVDITELRRVLARGVWHSAD